MPNNKVIVVIYTDLCIESEEGYFGQQQVPLTDEIKEILEEYPDDQIFKVCTFECTCVQNPCIQAF